jgi:2-dehydro-3-deoxygalactonokinase
MTGTEPHNTRWIGVDWGTSNMRVWVMGEGDQVITTLRSDRGMGQLSRDETEPALLALTSDHLPRDRVTPVFACGVVGAREGWAEAGYEAVPCEPPIMSAPVSAPCRDPRLAVRIIPGVKQARPADVMRGEETQIAGFLSIKPKFDGVLCLPGTHTKWARISAGEIVSFQTFMTGELFSLLAGQSVLRHSIAPDGWDRDAFAEALSDTLSKPESVAARLFTIRADALLSGASPVTARSRLSGLLIGMELAAARPYWLGQDIAIIGAQQPAEAYRSALAQQGTDPQVTEAEAMTLAGLISAYQGTKETTK